MWLAAGCNRGTRTLTTEGAQPCGYHAQLSPSFVSYFVVSINLEGVGLWRYPRSAPCPNQFLSEFDSFQNKVSRDRAQCGVRSDWNWTLCRATCDCVVGCGSHSTMFLHAHFLFDRLRFDQRQMPGAAGYSTMFGRESAYLSHPASVIKSTEGPGEPPALRNFQL